MSIDMHCHLDLYPDPFDVVTECIKRDLYILSVTTTPRAWSGTTKLGSGCDRIRTALGLHPQLAHERFHEIDLFDSLLPQAKYVGEIGLDGSKGFKEHWEIQIKVFRHILDSINKEGGRIMTIHSRGCISAVLDELKNVSGIPIMHWFTGTKNELSRAIDMGCWFSVGPAMLSTSKGMELVSIIPQNRILTETDGPFAKYRGKTLMPWDVNIAITQLANLWDCSLANAEQILKKNLKVLLTA